MEHMGMVLSFRRSVPRSKLRWPTAPTRPNASAVRMRNIPVPWRQRRLAGGARCSKNYWCLTNKIYVLTSKKHHICAIDVCFNIKFGDTEAKCLPRCVWTWFPMGADEFAEKCAARGLIPWETGTGWLEVPRGIMLYYISGWWFGAFFYFSIYRE